MKTLALKSFGLGIIVFSIQIGCMDKNLGVSSDPSKSYSDIDRPSEESEGIPGYFAQCQYVSLPTQQSAAATVHCKVDHKQLTAEEIRSKKYKWIVDTDDSLIVKSEELPLSDSFQQKISFQGDNPETILDLLDGTQLSVYGSNGDLLVSPVALNRAASNSPRVLGQNAQTFSLIDVPLTIESRATKECASLGDDDLAGILLPVACQAAVIDRFQFNKIEGLNKKLNLVYVDSNACQVQTEVTVSDTTFLALQEADCQAAGANSELSIESSGEVGSWLIKSRDGLCLTAIEINGNNLLSFELCNNTISQAFSITAMSGTE
ncbi:hypothetical protein [Pseudobacteriovorax antillogorgiicola]|uniref:hypothetical protein n=1 Tax=Pseudobacteriovorax antillogorgiicola TaxID=1513793 RepID=UPI001043D11D|nr:hypothetical protein [Pseudobacteriovorax antillogorgiicola]